ncbi:MAG: hypothetical protein C0407_14785, partial [Desulfobacca sp.]|nr:hypothetical protein [Desulfobacca sp.]
MKKLGLFVFLALWVVVIPSVLLASMVTVEIVADRSGGFPLYATGLKEPNTYRAYVEAIQGMRYAVRIRNNSPQRIGIVVAVDGRNIISGDKSFLKRNERMYVLDPYATGLYEGWRTAQNQVNRFYFTEAP